VLVTETPVRHISQCDDGSPPALPAYDDNAFDATLKKISTGFIRVNRLTCVRRLDFFFKNPSCAIPKIKL
jgi:hypothetical protein